MYRLQQPATDVACECPDVVTGYEMVQNLGLGFLGLIAFIVFVVALCDR